MRYPSARPARMPLPPSKDSFMGPQLRGSRPQAPGTVWNRSGLRVTSQRIDECAAVWVETQSSRPPVNTSNSPLTATPRSKSRYRRSWERAGSAHRKKAASAHVAPMRRAGRRGRRGEQPSECNAVECLTGAVWKPFDGIWSVMASGRAVPATDRWKGRPVCSVCPSGLQSSKHCCHYPRSRQRLSRWPWRATQAWPGSMASPPSRQVGYPAPRKRRFLADPRSQVRPRPTHRCDRNVANTVRVDALKHEEPRRSPLQ